MSFKPEWASIRTHVLPSWFDGAALGIFIHWGLYSVPAFAPVTWELGEVENDENWFCNNPYAEWYYNSVNVGRGPTYEHNVKTYGRDFPYSGFADMWRAERFDPDGWAALLKESGARYAVLTTKHHDGFCLWDSAYTDYNSAKRGPKRDIVEELTSSVRKSGLKMGYYYSGLIDWTFRHEPIYREADNFALACKSPEYAAYAINQYRELIDRFAPSVLWNDIGWPSQAAGELPELIAYYYNTVEDGVINSRWACSLEDDLKSLDELEESWNDFEECEYQMNRAFSGRKWEMTRGLGLSFGYNANEPVSRMLSAHELIALLVGVVSQGGNLLINIGPRADGVIPSEQAYRLRELGSWLERNAECIYDVKKAQKPLKIEGGADLKIWHTAKPGALYTIIDGIRAPAELLFKGDYSEAKALDGAVAFEAKPVDEGVKVSVKAVPPNGYPVAFKLK